MTDLTADSTATDTAERLVDLDPELCAYCGDALDEHDAEGRTAHREFVVRPFGSDEIEYR